MLKDKEMTKEVNKERDHSLQRPAVFANLKVGDRLERKSGTKAVVAYMGPDFAVLRFPDNSESAHFGSYVEQTFRFQPLCWVEDKPVYRGDELYRPAVEKDKALVVSHIERSDSGVEHLYFGNLAGATEFADNRRGYLTWTKPEQKREPSFQVESQDVFPGDTVYYCGDNKDNWGDPYTVKENARVVRQVTGCGGRVNLFNGGALAFRLKPVLVIGDQLVPMTEREAPAEGTTYFTPDPHSVDHYGSYIWRNLESNQRFLERGLIHLDKEAAIAHGEALVALSKKKD